MNKIIDSIMNSITEGFPYDATADDCILIKSDDLIAAIDAALSNRSDFGQAIENMKLGYNMQRQGWNGKGMHVYLEEGRHLPIAAGAGHGTTRVYDQVFVMYTAQGTHQAGWLASQADMLAEDWQHA